MKWLTLAQHRTLNNNVLHMNTKYNVILDTYLTCAFNLPLYAKIKDYNNPFYIHVTIVQ